MTTPGQLQVDTKTGRITGSAHLTYNSPWPCPNGTYGSGAIMGVLMHTMVGNLPGTVQWFNNRASQVSAHFGIAQDGEIHQFGPIGKGWIAWHAAAANHDWYGIEHADNGAPVNPLTPAQITASAQLVEVLARFAGFPLRVTDSPASKGYGTHVMGGAAWGGHTCPGPGPRAGQRPAIITLAEEIRTPAPPPAGPYRHLTDGHESAEQIAASRGVSVEYLFEFAARHYTPADMAEAGKPVLPAGIPYYTSRP